VIHGYAESNDRVNLEGCEGYERPKCEMIQCQKSSLSLIVTDGAIQYRN